MVSLILRCSGGFFIYILHLLIEKYKNTSLPKFTCLRTFSIIDLNILAPKRCMCMCVCALSSPESTYSKLSSDILGYCARCLKFKDIFQMYLPPMVEDVLGTYISAHFPSSFPIQLSFYKSGIDPTSYIRWREYRKFDLLKRKWWWNPINPGRREKQRSPSKMSKGPPNA